MKHLANILVHMWKLSMWIELCIQANIGFWTFEWCLERLSAAKMKFAMHFSGDYKKNKYILPNFSGKNWLVHLSIGHQLGTIDFTKGTPVRLHIFSCLMIFVDDGYCELGILTGAFQCVTCTFARMAYDHYMTVLGIRDSSSSSTRENMNSEKRNHLKHDIIISTDI